MNILQYHDNPRVRRALANIKKQGKIRVLFVCLGNICRSPAAEGLMKEAISDRNSSLQWTIDSAGTGNYHIGDLPDPRMRAHARRRGLTLDHHCRQINPYDFDDFDLIIGMDASNISNLRRLAPSPEAEEKILPMSDFFGISTKYDYVPDPYYDGAEGFELVLDLLTDATVNLRDTAEAALGNSLA